MLQPTPLSDLLMWERYTQWLIISSKLYIFHISAFTCVLEYQVLVQGKLPTSKEQSAVCSRFVPASCQLGLAFTWQLNKTTKKPHKTAHDQVVTNHRLLIFAQHGNYHWVNLLASNPGFPLGSCLVALEKIFSKAARQNLEWKTWV